MLRSITIPYTWSRRTFGPHVSRTISSTAGWSMRSRNRRAIGRNPPKRWLAMSGPGRGTSSTSTAALRAATSPGARARRGARGTRGGRSGSARRPSSARTSWGQATRRGRAAACGRARWSTSSVGVRLVPLALVVAEGVEEALEVGVGLVSRRAPAFVSPTPGSCPGARAVVDREQGRGILADRRAVGVEPAHRDRVAVDERGLGVRLALGLREPRRIRRRAVGTRRARFGVTRRGQPASWWRWRSAVVVAGAAWPSSYPLARGSA